ncbi:hypothetical protein HMPREF2861_04230 [Lactobacillus sp. HMSC068F07]|nr:hypothetical protein HMPREF2861_04230 [Lactobacillus sp. HMSC068F07]
MALGVMAVFAIAPEALTRRLLRRGARYGVRTYVFEVVFAIATKVLTCRLLRQGARYSNRTHFEQITPNFSRIYPHLLATG